jgi:hypothetical protein
MDARRRLAEPMAGTIFFAGAVGEPGGTALRVEQAAPIHPAAPITN